MQPGGGCIERPCRLITCWQNPRLSGPRGAGRERPGRAPGVHSRASHIYTHTYPCFFKKVCPVKSFPRPPYPLGGGAHLSLNIPYRPGCQVGWRGAAPFSAAGMPVDPEILKFANKARSGQSGGRGPAPGRKGVGCFSPGPSPGNSAVVDGRFPGSGVWQDGRTWSFVPLRSCPREGGSQVFGAGVVARWRQKVGCLSQRQTFPLAFLQAVDQLLVAAGCCGLGEPTGFPP